MSKRNAAKTLAQWQKSTRQWATDAGRQLALDLYNQREPVIRPYNVGLVLDPGEQVWAEAPARFNLDWPTSPGAAVRPDDLAFRPWLVTSDRLVGRLSDDRLRGYRWERAVGSRIDLTPGQECVCLDVEGEPSLIWSGPGVAPIAVAAAFRLFGPVGVVEHPGLAVLRDSPRAETRI